MKDLRIVVVSSFSESDGARAVDALTGGAFELVPKQSSSGKLQDFLDDLLAKVEAAAHEPHRERERIAKLADLHITPVRRSSRKRTIATTGKRLVIIAASTGGPRALTTVVSKLPATLGQGILIVQHMPSGFTKSLASRLDAYSKIHVTEAGNGVRVTAGDAFVAPGGRHMRLNGHRIKLSDEAPIAGLRPCADITISDAVNEYGPNIVLAVLTGMGRDACAGAELVRDAGGVVIAERGDTTTVNGMPKAVIDAGLADVIVPIEEVAGAIEGAAGG